MLKSFKHIQLAIALVGFMLSAKVCPGADRRVDTLSVDSLEQFFETPPPDCRPRVFWDWMGGLISKEGITKDLEALASHGVGGVMIMQMADQVTDMPISLGKFPNKVACLSDEWFEMVNYAIGEADRLGMSFAIFMCPGWSHAGGRWITPEKGLKKLVASQVDVSGPVVFNQVIPKAPKLNGPGSGNAEKLRLSFGPPYYKDIAILAVPVGKDSVSSVGNIVNITKYMHADGLVNWKVPKGSWKIIRLGMASENGVNHPAPLEGTGLESDRMDTAAVRLVFNGIVGRIWKEAKAKGYRSFKAFETDSYEGGFQDFGADFQEQFKRRRGYDCLSWLPAWMDKNLVIGNNDLTQRFRYDMLRTISELIAERFHGQLRRLADEHQLTWQTEPYWGMSIDWRTSGGHSGLPGSEFWINGGQVVNPSSALMVDTWDRMMKTGQIIGAAPDIAALYGLPVVWAESFTAESYNSAWRNDPWVLKPWGDAVFCNGVNQFYIHGFTHNPFDDRYQPGVTMGYWGTQMNRHMTWLPYAASWHRYLARCQYMLRQGRPVYDILAYPAISRPISGPVADAGPFRQVVLNDESLFTRIAVKQGRITIKGGGDFAALVLAPNTAIRPEALRKIRDLVKAGATLIALPPPSSSPSLEHYPACDNEVASLIKEIWGNGGAGVWHENKLGSGRVYATNQFSEVLDKIAGGPDLRFTGVPDSALQYLNFMHRRDGSTDIYFVCNTGDEPRNVLADFRIKGLVPEQWDPVTGEKRKFHSWEHKDNHTILPLKLEARQSVFIVFKKEASAGTAGEVILAPLKPVLRINGSWNISFDPHWGGPEHIVFDRLEDWSKRPEQGIRYYSGTAVYQKSFDMTLTGNENAASQYYLDIGTVHNLARITLNGKDLGVVWCAPWRIKIPAGLLREKENKLLISVVNAWVNRLIGDEQEPVDCDLVDYTSPTNRKGSYNIDLPSRRLDRIPDWLIDHKPRPSAGRFTFSTWYFYNKDAPLLPAGLLGPVRIMSAGDRN